MAVDAPVRYDDWGYRLQEISAKIHIFHGAENRIVPLGYAERIAANVPHCDLHILRGQGRLFPIDQQSLISVTALDELNKKC